MDNRKVATNAQLERTSKMLNWLTHQEGLKAMGAKRFESLNEEFLSSGREPDAIYMEGIGANKFSLVVFLSFATRTRDPMFGSLDIDERCTYAEGFYQAAADYYIIED